jgi:hypothetical protein
MKKFLKDPASLEWIESWESSSISKKCDFQCTHLLQMRSWVIFSVENAYFVNQLNRTYLQIQLWMNGCKVTLSKFTPSVCLFKGWKQILSEISPFA